MSWAVVFLVLLFFRPFRLLVSISLAVVLFLWGFDALATWLTTPNF